MTAAAAIDASLPFHVFSTVEPLRADYARLESTSYPSIRLDEPPSRLLRKSAAALEMLQLIGGIWEFLATRGLRWVELSPSLLGQIESDVLKRVRLDAEAVALEFLDCFGPPPSVPAVIEPSAEALSRAVRSALEQIPIEHLEDLAARTGLEPFGHRCRVAYDALRAFTRRIDPAQQNQLRVAGEAFARGSLSLVDIATLLAVHPVDAVDLLESHGYYRPVEALALGDDERKTRLAAIRADRLHRGGAPAWTQEAISRDTVASERIEGVDARRWILRGGA